jgi:hypothetical protein
LIQRPGWPASPSAGPFKENPMFEGALYYVVIEHFDPPGFYGEIVNEENDAIHVTALYPTEAKAIAVAQAWTVAESIKEANRDR